MPTAHEQIRALVNKALASPTMNLPDFLMATKPGSVILDIGANEGGMVEYFLQRGASKVYAFEPVPSIYLKMADRFKGDPRVEANMIGFSDKCGKLTGVSLLNAYTLGRKGEYGLPVSKESPPDAFDVDLLTVDFFLETGFTPPLPAIDFIKLDVDGYEFHALRGMEKTLAKYQPAVMIELSFLPATIGENCEAMVRWIYAHGYSLCTMDGRVCFEPRQVLEAYPWHTSFDMMMLPTEMTHNMHSVVS